MGRGGALGSRGGEGVLVLAIGAGVGEEAGVGAAAVGGGAEEAPRLGEGDVDGEGEGGEEVEQGKAERFGLEEERRFHADPSHVFLLLCIGGYSLSPFYFRENFLQVALIS